MLKIKHDARIRRALPSHLWSLNMDLCQVNVAITVPPSHGSMSTFWPAWELVHCLVAEATTTILPILVINVQNTMN
jgi:hypothetical protein